MKIGIRKITDNLFELNPRYGDLRKDKQCKDAIYANSDIKNIFPDAFTEMALNCPHSINIKMNTVEFKRKLLTNIKGKFVIEGLKPQDFNYVMTGDKGCRYFYANLREYYCFLVNNIPDATKSLNFQDIEQDNHNAGYFYNNPQTNLKYVYEKCYGYTGTYYCMFKDLFNQIVKDYKGQKLNFHVVSIGCGIKNDALALRYAIDKRQEQDIQFGEVNYVGIDPGNWTEDNNIKYLFCYNKTDKYVIIPKCSKTFDNPKAYYVERSLVSREASL